MTGNENVITHEGDPAVNEIWKRHCKINIAQARVVTDLKVETPSGA